MYALSCEREVVFFSWDNEDGIQGTIYETKCNLSIIMKTLLVASLAPVKWTVK